MTYRCLNHPSCHVPLPFELDQTETHSLVCASQNTGRPITGTDPRHKWRGHSVVQGRHSVQVAMSAPLHGGQVPDSQDLEPVGYDGFGAPLYAHQLS